MFEIECDNCQRQCLPIFGRFVETLTLESDLHGGENVERMRVLVERLEAGDATARDDCFEVAETGAAETFYRSLGEVGCVLSRPALEAKIGEVAAKNGATGSGEE